MTYDARRKVVVLVGGAACSGSSTPTNDVWEWDGVAWTQIPSGPTVPKARVRHALAYDPIRERTLLFGGGVGRSGSVPYSDTWSWDGVQWTELQPSSIPDARSDASLVWDAARQHLLLVGGYLVNDVWEWDGSDWTIVPGPPVNGAVVSVSGLDGAGIIAISTSLGFAGGDVSLRKLSWSAPTAYEGCWSGDHDSDGLVGCADPDCWAMCAPSCPPGAPCDSQAPRCGDTTCNPALESCHSCPEDCGACAAVCGDFVCAAGEACPGDCDW